MEFTVKRNDIIDVLSKIQGIAGRKSSLAITENVLIRSTDKGISIAATDLETGFEGFYPATIESGGSIAINSKKLFEIVRNFPSEDIVISEVEKKWFKIGNIKVEYNIAGMDPDDFPEIPTVENVDFFNINSTVYKKMIERTIMIGFAGDEKRAHILGVSLECIDAEDEAIIRMVSTDGKRLTKVDYSYLKQNIGLQPGKNVIVPKKGLSEVIKFLESEGDVQVGIKENYFVLKKDNETIIVNLLEGSFPDFEDVMNIDDGNVLELNKNSFKMMLKRMSILTSEDYKGVIFKFADGKLEITTANPDIGESKEDMDIDYKKESIEVAFNPQFFIDTLNFIESEKVFLNIKDEEHPCLIQGEDDKMFLSIIMPMKI